MTVRGKRWRWPTALVLLVVLCCLAETALRLCGPDGTPGEDDPFVRFAGDAPVFVRESRGDGEAVLRTHPDALGAFNQQYVTMAKPDGTYRIVCAGGSVTYGFPGDHATSFGGWLEAMLPEIDSSRRWEIINAGGRDHAAYRVARICRELVACDPDLLILYTGNHELLEPRTYPEPVRGESGPVTVLHSRVLGLLKTVWQMWHRPDLPERPVLPARMVPLVDQGIAFDVFTEQRIDRGAALRHFRESLVRILDMAEARGVRVILVVPGVDLRNTRPFCSRHSPEEPVDGAFDEADSLFARAERHLQAGGAGRAMERIDAAIAIDPGYAAYHYLRGQALDASGWDNRAAYAAFEQALAWDYAPLRAPAEFRDAVRQLAAERGVAVVDGPAVAAIEALDNIPDRSIFVDHIHPSARGNRLLAYRLLDVMQQQGMVPEGSMTHPMRRRVEQVLNERVSPKDRGLAVKRLARFWIWAENFSEASGMAKLACRFLPDDPEAWFLQGVGLEHTYRPERAVEAYRRALELEPGLPDARERVRALTTETRNPDRALP